MRRGGRKGSAIVEFAMTGIPLMFVWISIVQMALGMWHYHTLQYASKMGGVYLQTHGHDYCISPGNTCTISTVAQVIANNAIGMLPSQITATFTPYDLNGNVGTAVTCSPLTACQTGGASASTQWFPTGYDFQTCQFTIKLEYQFNSALAMVAPGNGVVRFANSYWFPAFTHQTIIF